MAPHGPGLMRAKSQEMDVMHGSHLLIFMKETPLKQETNKSAMT
jgi:hypothetical protein